MHSIKSVNTSAAHEHRDYQRGFDEGYKQGVAEKANEYKEIIEALKQRVSANRRSIELAQVMYQISELSHDSKLDISVLYEGICNVLSTIVDTTNFFIARFNKEAQSLEFVYYRDSSGLHHETPEDFPKRPVGKGFTELVLERQAPVLLGKKDIQMLCESGERAARKMLAASWLGVPLEEDGDVFGAIIIQSYDDNVLFNQSDVELLTFVSNNISHAIKRYEEKLEKERSLQKLALASQRDPLTGLLNRTAFDETLEKACASIKSEHFIAVLFIDLDGFKLVNDTYGHAEGDSVLRSVAKLIKAETRACDAVGRIGGDEFVVMLADIESSAQAEDVAKRILDSIATFQSSNRLTVELGASIGIAIASQGSACSKSLVERADAAMYNIKHTGKNAFALEEM